MNGKKWKKSLVYDWPLYLALPVLFGVAVSYTLQQVHQPQAYEKLNVFFASKSVESDEFCSLLDKRFAPDGLKETTTVQSNPSDSVFYQKLQVVGYSGSDLFLLPESVLLALSPDDILLRFSDELEKDYVSISSPTYYEKDGYAYGLRVKEKDVASPLSSFADFLEEDYYLCFNVKSKNLGDLGLYENPEHNLALLAFSYLSGGVL